MNDKRPRRAAVANGLSWATGPLSLLGGKVELGTAFRTFLRAPLQEGVADRTSEFTPPWRFHHIGTHQGLSRSSELLNGRRSLLQRVEPIGCLHVERLGVRFVAVQRLERNSIPHEVAPLMSDYVTNPFYHRLSSGLLEEEGDV